MRKFFIFFLILSFSSCASIDADVEEFKKTKVPKYFSTYLTKKDSSERWWEQFKSDELNSLVEKALRDNFNLQSAVARLKQAYFSNVKIGSVRYPDLSLNALASKNEKGAKKLENSVVTNNYSLGLSTSYEIDLWGRIGNQKKSSLLKLKASKEDLNTVAFTVVSKITTTWINLISVRKQKKLFYEQLDINEKMFALVKLRLNQSMATMLDFYQQKQAVASIKKKIIPVEAREKQLLSTLNLLLGKSPNTKTKVKQKNFPQIIDTPKTGLPSDVIALRPDIKSAELKLKAVGYDVLVAKKNRFPRLNITASYTYSNSDSSLLFDDWIKNFVLNLTIPIFAGGKLKAEQKRVESVREELFLNYKSAVMTAIKEVEDALVKEDEYKKEYAANQNQIQIADETFDEAKNRYFNGAGAFLPVLQAEISLINYKQSKIVANANLLISRINLYKALGSKISIKINNKDINKKLK